MLKSNQLQHHSSSVSRRHEERATGRTTYYSRSPSLHLKGDWLEALGFNTGQPVTVTAEHCRLVIESVDITI
ncbi:TPA: type I toxin-antitoxin system SymE family toxin [Klebsiella variicola subsp. variicola]|nr:type I toxin-antitoxin system SymE family toxin [Klebsiella variicola subsp. variicola]HCF6490883.1 type I toxin-antitoxin system SymE family toxin [Klebsiella variicola subsp. variicola]HCI9144569.1 type I toxin-antitoxin system SymE family toxin [Klebsiella variicola]HDU4820441.1 type I toxin-antitoxin system SymE family toxin [Klebsiella variicola]